MALDIVKVQQGLLSGVAQTGKYEGNTVFSGVPYAKPPVGELRWKPPVDPAPWEGVRECDTYAPRAIQLVRRLPCQKVPGFQNLVLCLQPCDADPSGGDRHGPRRRKTAGLARQRRKLWLDGSG